MVRKIKTRRSTPNKALLHQAFFLVAARGTEPPPDDAQALCLGQGIDFLYYGAFQRDARGLEVAVFICKNKHHRVGFVFVTNETLVKAAHVMASTPPLRRQYVFRFVSWVPAFLAKDFSVADDTPLLPQFGAVASGVDVMPGTARPSSLRLTGPARKRGHRPGRKSGHKGSKQDRRRPWRQVKYPKYRGGRS